MSQHVSIALSRKKTSSSLIIQPKHRFSDQKQHISISAPSTLKTACPICPIGKNRITGV